MVWLRVPGGGFAGAAMALGLTFRKSTPCVSSMCIPSLWAGPLASCGPARRLHQVSIYDTDKDPAPFFFSSSVQNILMYLTRIEYSKVFRKRVSPGTKLLSTPVYKLMTDEELQEELKLVEQKVKRLIQMPPVVKARQPITQVLSEDSLIDGFDTSKYVFVDISLHVKDKDRFITIREPNGTLRHADHDIRKRMNMIYNPFEGRELKEPDMFTDETYFNRVLERKDYEFILDRACVQYDPDDPFYQKITASTYGHCDFNKDYQILRSTRHFGPMTFYLAWNNMMDNLLLDLLLSQNITEAIALIHLRRLIETVDKVNTVDLVNRILAWKKEEKLNEKLEVDLIKESIPHIHDYIQNNSVKKGPLQLALQSFEEIFESKLKMDEGIRLAHGTN